MFPTKYPLSRQSTPELPPPQDDRSLPLSRQSTPVPSLSPDYKVLSSTPPLPGSSTSSPPLPEESTPERSLSPDDKVLPLSRHSTPARSLPLDHRFLEPPYPEDLPVAPTIDARTSDFEEIGSLLSQDEVDIEFSARDINPPPQPILQLILKPQAEPVTTDSADRARRDWEEKANAFDFDEDLHIVDPEAHFHLLGNLAKQVVGSSHFWRERSSMASHIPNRIASLPEFWRESANLALPFSFKQQLDARVPIWMQLKRKIKNGQTTLGLLLHLLKSFSIINGVCQSVEKMKQQRFCSESINILRQHQIKGVIDVRQIECDDMFGLNSYIEKSVTMIFSNLDEETLETEIQKLIAPCRKIMLQVGFKEFKSEAMGLAEILTTLRKTALFLDIALVSYVGSHSFRENIPLLKSKTDVLEVLDGDDPYGFRCSWRRLACLAAFLDEKEVLVFDLLDKNQKIPPQQGADSYYTLLARMTDLADIWGPVHAVSFVAGQIKFYGVSKGVICRVQVQLSTLIPGAVQCHYFSRSSFVERMRYYSFPLLMAEEDLLLIGGGLVENQDCTYTITDFMKDNSLDVIILGACESVWKTESRTATFGFSKYLGVSVSGSQKLVPQTTRKQHILDKWTTNPSRANPGILNLFLGVEISHCTGNARRVSLRQLISLPAVWTLLERQFPGWTETSWGKQFCVALQGDDDEDIFRVWRRCAPDRNSMAELVCLVLEILDKTGRRERERFHAALLYQDDESAYSVESRLNDWSIVLEDTHITCAYAAISEQCLDCRLPNDIASSCRLLKACTVLETEIAIGNNEEVADEGFYKMRSSGQRLKVAESGDSQVTMLEPIVLFVSPLKRYTDIMERCNRQHWTNINVTFFKASRPSFHGKLEQRPTRPVTQLNLEPKEAQNMDLEPGRIQDLERNETGWNAERRVSEPDLGLEITFKGNGQANSSERVSDSERRTNHKNGEERNLTENHSTREIAGYPAHPTSFSVENQVVSASQELNVAFEPPTSASTSQRPKIRKQLTLSEELRHNSRTSAHKHQADLLSSPPKSSQILDGEDLIMSDINGQDFYASSTSTSNGFLEDY